MRFSMVVAVMKAWLNRLLWAAVVFLSLVGVSTVAARFAFPADMVLRMQPTRVRVLEALGRPDPAAVTRLPELERFDRRFAERRTLTLWHIFSGGLFIVFAPLQLARSVRRRFPVLHRWSGRFLLVIGSVAALTGLYFGVALPIAGVAESTIVAIVGGLFLLAITRAFSAIRRRDAVSHREWMLRAFGVMMAVPATRVVGVILDVAFAPMGISPVTLLAVDLWVTWLLVIGATEWWIRYARLDASNAAATARAA